MPSHGQMLADRTISHCLTGREMEDDVWSSWVFPRIVRKTSAQEQSNIPPPKGDSGAAVYERWMPMRSQEARFGLGYCRKASSPLQMATVIVAAHFITARIA